MYAGKEIRLKGDPGRLGICMDKTSERAGRILVLVKFMDQKNTEYVPLDQIDFRDEISNHPLDSLQEGKLGNQSDLRRILTHIRLNGRLIDLIYSMEISNTDFFAYQFKPILKLLNSITNGILIADEVGLGKTIEAGLIWTELKSRFDYRRLMVVCPAVLREKWQYELRNKFGIEAQILNADNTLKVLQQSVKEGPYSEFAIICSMQGLRSYKKGSYYSSSASSQLEDFLENFKYESSLIDCLIIDEAHYLRNPRTKTAKLGKRLRNVAENLILLSATPVHLDSIDLYQLLNLLDEDTFSHPSAFDNIIKANEPLIKIRDSLISKKLSHKEFISLVKNAQRHPLLKENRQLNYFIQTPPSDQELNDNAKRSYFASRFDTINILGHVISRTRKREVQEWKVIREPNAEKITLTPVERNFYEFVTETVREFCNKANYFEGFLLVIPQRQMSSSMPAALRSWQKKREEYIDQMTYEDLGQIDDIDTTKIGPLTRELILRSEEFGNYEELYKNDSKYCRLELELNKRFNNYPNDKIVLFSYFRQTILYLSERLTEIGIKNIVLMGGEKVDKTAIIEKFRTSPDIRILLSTEVGSEGIDLQFSSVLINYDLPWNPMRVEQRIGRLDRLGQKAEKILIWNLFYDNTIDSRIYDRLYKRLRIFEQSLGGLEPVIGEEIRNLTMDLLREKLTPAQEQERIDQTSIAIENKRMEEENLEKEAAHLIAYGDYVLNKVKAAHELNRWITGQDIKTYVLDYINLNYPGCDIKLLDKTEVVYELTLTEEIKDDLENFIREQKIKTSTKLIRLRIDKIRCKFENKLFSNDNRIELINQIHPLVRFITYKISNQENPVYPTVSIKLKNDDYEKGLYVFTVQKWILQAIQDIEKLYYSVFQVNPNNILLSEEDSEKIVTQAAQIGEPWYEAINQVDVIKMAKFANENCLVKSDEEYNKFQLEYENLNNDRADIQIMTLENHLVNQRNKIIEINHDMEVRGRQEVIKMNEGRIQKLEQRINTKIKKIREKRQIKIRKEEIAIGIIEIV